MRAVRRNLFATLIAACLSQSILPAHPQTGQTFPQKPIRLIVPGTGQLDTLARMMGSRMAEGLGQPVVIENYPGAGGILAANRVAKAVADGHSLLLATTGFAISAALHPSLPYDPRKDFSGVSQIGIPTTVLVAAPSLGIRSVNDLITLAKSRPGKIIFGSPGPGTGPYLLGEKFRLGSGISVMNVGFKTGQATLIETLTGRVHYCFLPLGSVLPQIQDGKLLALAVTTPKRSPVLPELPTMAETLPDFARQIGSYGLLAPALTPPRILTQISEEVMRILTLQEVRGWMRDDGLIPAPTTPSEYDKMLHAQIDAFAELIRVTGIPTR